MISHTKNHHTYAVKKRIFHRLSAAYAKITPDITVRSRLAQ